MKRLIYIFILLLSFSQAHSQVSLGFGSIEAATETEITVDLLMDNSEVVKAIQLDFYFDPNLSPISVTQQLLVLESKMDLLLLLMK